MEEQEVEAGLVRGGAMIHTHPPHPAGSPIHRLPTLHATAKGTALPSVGSEASADSR